MVRGMGSLGSNYNALITVLQKKVQGVCMAKRQCKIVCGSIHKTQQTLGSEQIYARANMEIQFPEKDSRITTKNYHNQLIQ